MCDTLTLNTPSLRFSVVVPTFNRRDLVVRCVESLSSQTFTGHYEVVVVVDGSTDGTADALRGMRIPIPMKVIEQANGGAASARNRGAEESTGEILLFLDDDMEADEGLLAAHDASHRSGAAVVIGDIPLHPDSPDTLVSRIVGQWALRRRNRLMDSGNSINPRDLLTGQISLARSLYHSVGGFDQAFTRGGGFGNEDTDLGCRLMNRRCRIVFNPLAVSRQRFVVTPDTFLKRSRALGNADVHLAHKHPGQAFGLFRQNGVFKRSSRFFWRPLQRLPFLLGLVATFLRRFAVRLIETRPTSRQTKTTINLAWLAGYWWGIGEAGGIPRLARIRVLAYHAIQELDDAPVVGNYAVPPSIFARQIELLSSAGCRFISGDQLAGYLLQGADLPERAVLLTFDDCYTDLCDTVLPFLAEHQVPAVAFAVAGRIGGTNTWDQAPGCKPLDLLTADALRVVSAGGIEIGAHSKTHRPLTRIDRDELLEETAGAIDDIERLGLSRPRFFSYPHGLRNKKVIEALSGSGIVAAFTVDRGMTSSENDPYQLPRIEIVRRHGAGLAFMFRVATAGVPFRIDRESLLLLWDLLKVSWKGKPKPKGKFFGGIPLLRLPGLTRGATFPMHHTMHLSRSTGPGTGLTGLLKTQVPA